MASPGGEKPYRLYRGGRVKGRVPSPGRPEKAPPRAQPERDGKSRYRGPGPKPTARKPRKVRWSRELAIALVLIVLFFIVWGVLGYLTFHSGVSAANKRLSRTAKSALAPDQGTLLSNPSSILLLGTDHSLAASRSGDRHSDSITLLRTDPSHGRLYYLSIPRDLQATIPGYSTQKINAAFQIGGPALAIKTVSQFTGVDINHIVIVNFGAFKDLINALGGIDVNVPKPIRSNRFDCPYATQARCAQWPGWRFPKGLQHMTGERALIYSRIRENVLDPAETDVTRGARQQLVIDALASKFTSPGTLLGLPFDGGSLAKPLTTDLSAGQLMQLGWVKFRASASSSVHCRLGGDFGAGGNGSPSEDNPATIAMFLGKSAPQLPTGPFNPGCVVGHTLQ